MKQLMRVTFEDLKDLKESARPAPILLVQVFDQRSSLVDEDQLLFVVNRSVWIL